MIHSLCKELIKITQAKNHQTFPQNSETQSN